MAIIEHDDMTVTFEDTPEVKEAVFQKVLQYFKDHKCYWGESVMQMDAPQINAPEVMADICDDVLKFKVKHKDD